MNRAINIGCRILIAMASALAVAAVYSPYGGATVGGIIMLIDMWVSDIVVALKERQR